MTFAPIDTNGFFLPTTLPFPKETEELIQRLYKFYEDVATRLNVKEIGIFDLRELLDGQQWFTPGNPQVYRYGFRQVYSIGPIAPGATSTTPHGITGFSTLTFTHIYGTAVTGTTNRPIPYSSVTALNQQIEINVDNTLGGNINITNGAGAPNITSAIIVLEYLKN